MGNSVHLVLARQASAVLEDRNPFVAVENEPMSCVWSKRLLFLASKLSFAQRFPGLIGQNQVTLDLARKPTETQNPCFTGGK
jgi:hypothetical protein